jgi:hypothetical protein
VAKQEQMESGSKIIAGMFIRPLSYLTALMAAFIIPFMIWSAWAHRSTLHELLIQTALCISFAWAIVAMLQAQHSLRKLGLSSSDRVRLFSGSRPTDPDELRAWKWAWQFMYAVIAGLIAMIAIPVTAWFAGK